MFEKFAKNTQGCDYVVGDIHGCFSQLRAALVTIGFNVEVDRLFSVGDLVDRGPENEEFVEWLKLPWFFPVRGNHDEFVASHDEIGDMRATHLYNGGAWFIYLVDAEQREYMHAMRTLPIAIEVATDDGSVGIVHAEVPNDDWKWFTDKLLNPDEQFEHISAVSQWGRTRIQQFRYGKNLPNVDNIDMVCVGHTVVEEPISVGNVMYLDTGAVRTGMFTLLCIQGANNGKVFQVQKEM